MDSGTSKQDAHDVVFPHFSEAESCISLESKIEFAKKSIRWSSAQFGAHLAMSTSFGIQSAVLLHLISQTVPDIPVIFIDTGYLFPETYQYSMELTDSFGLNTKTYQSSVSVAQMEALYGRIWEDEDPEKRRLYGLLRKVIPMKRAKKELRALCIIAGLRGGQTDHRAGLANFEYNSGDDCYKMYPLLFWTKDDIEDYFQAFQLPRHPLYHQGFTTVGDAHSSRPRSEADTSDRATRFGGTGQQECGLHTEKLSLEEYEEYVHSALRSCRASYGSLLSLDPSSEQTGDSDGFTVYGKPNCRYCRAAKLVLSARRIPFKESHIVTVLSRMGNSISKSLADESSGPSSTDSNMIEEGATQTAGGIWHLGPEGETDDGLTESEDDSASKVPPEVSEVTSDWLTRRLRAATSDRLFTFSTVPQILLDGEHIGGYTELCTYLNVTQGEAEGLLSRAQQELQLEGDKTKGKIATTDIEK